MIRAWALFAGLPAIFASTASLANENRSSEYAMEAPYRVTTSLLGGHLNVRSVPTTDSPVVGRLRSGTGGLYLKQCADDGPWCLIEPGNIRGWVSMRFMNGYAD